MSSKQAAGSMAPLDPLGVDAFIDYDQLYCNSPPLSPMTSRRQSASAMATSNNTLLPPANALGSSSQPSFAGPSFQYGLYRQQTPLPVGALASTLAINEASFNLGRSRSGLNTSHEDSFFGTSTTDDLLAVAASSTHHPSFSGASDIDMDFDSSNGEPVPPFSFPDDSTSSEFVDPSTLGPQDDFSDHQSLATTPLPEPSSVGRLWPGMHQQRAAMAKAEQERQQQSRQQLGQTATTPKPRAQPAMDPLVEEKISRLLGSMRQGSATSSSDVSESSRRDGAGSHAARMKKDEEDMDEDERLLASEEGKKLSSKERRQLRNKVSARAFRSRRKEYIGQLEAEISAKSSEANMLRQENRALRDENTRLSDLTRMLLSSSAFSNFLDDLGAAGLPANAVPAQPSASSEPARQSNARSTTNKDPNPAALAEQQLQALQEESPRVGMTLLPDETADFSMLEPSSGNAWPLGGVTAGIWGLDQPQVFAVMDIPNGPAVDGMDLGLVSGKSAPSFGSPCSLNDSKPDSPMVPSLPSFEVKAQKPACAAIIRADGTDEADSAFSPFDDSPATESTESAERRNATGVGYLFGLGSQVAPRKDGCDLSHTAPAVECSGCGPSQVALQRFDQIRVSAEAAFQRVSRITSHL